MKEKIDKLVEKLEKKDGTKVLYLYDLLGGIRVRIYDKHYNVKLKAYLQENQLYTILKGML